MRLDPSALLSLAAASLTAGADRPFIAKTPQEVLFATLHAAMLLLEFSFCGLGEEGGIQTKSDLASPKPLPNEWNSNSESFALRYRHGKSALTFLLKGIKLGKKLGVYALTMEVLTD